MKQTKIIQDIPEPFIMNLIGPFGSEERRH
jgi:hypothetical protein